MNLKQLWDKYRNIINYLFFGVLTTVVNVVVYSCCYDVAKFSNLLSTLIAWVVAVLVAFVTNKLFVFESKSWIVAVVVKEVVDFTICRVGTGVIEMGMMWLFVDMLAFSGTMMKIITNVIVIILNYVASKFWIFVQK